MKDLRRRDRNKIETKRSLNKEEKIGGLCALGGTTEIIAKPSGVNYIICIYRERERERDREREREREGGGVIEILTLKRYQSKYTKT